MWLMILLLLLVLVLVLVLVLFLLGATARGELWPPEQSAAILLSI
jgi:hypothetical protein